MRVWHWTLAMVAVAIALTIARDAAGRVSLAVFVTGLGEVVLGTGALLALFRSFAAVGEAEGFAAHMEALAVAASVLAVGSFLMIAWMFLGAHLVRAAAA